MALIVPTEIKWSKKEGRILCRKYLGTNKYDFLLFLTHVMVEKELFLGQIFELEILMDSHVLRSPESENHIFSKWSVCVCVCMLSA